MGVPSHLKIAGPCLAGWYIRLLTVTASSPSSFRAMKTLPSEVAPPPTIIVVQAEAPNRRRLSDSSREISTATGGRVRVMVGLERLLVVFKRIQHVGMYLR